MMSLEREREVIEAKDNDRLLLIIWDEIKSRQKTHIKL